MPLKPLFDPPTLSSAWSRILTQSECLHLQLVSLRRVQLLQGLLHPVDESTGRGVDGLAAEVAAAAALLQVLLDAVVEHLGEDDAELGEELVLVLKAFDD